MSPVVSHITGSWVCIVAESGGACSPMIGTPFKGHQYVRCKLSDEPAHCLLSAVRHDTVGSRVGYELTDRLEHISTEVAAM
jgi:hypothetical protein